MRKTWIAAVGLLALLLATVAADAPPATQPAPPLLLAKLSAMPQDIWVYRDAATSTKWKFEPNRIRWYMQQFPSKNETYGEDTFTGIAKVHGQPHFKNPKLPEPYITVVTTNEYTICGQTFKFMVSFCSNTPPTWHDGETITVKGPTQYWDYDDFTRRFNPSAPNEVRYVRVSVNPELEPPSGYTAPMRLKQMGQ